MNPSSHSITCPQCHSHYEIAATKPLNFCPFCGCSLSINFSNSTDIIGGRYKLLKGIGKGGMGEVLLVYDQSCERQIALKRIREDLIKHPQVRNRFLKEAHITCQLTHPAIIPIYTIHGSDESAYYTMPFVEGETLKQIIKRTRKKEKIGEKLDSGSILALVRTYLTVCQAVAYAHSKGVLHRDLKLENIIIGKYGEVFILDWGLAKFIKNPSQEEEEIVKEQTKSSMHQEITRIGKVVGTIAYMAPERAIGHPANIQTDIYSLGVILYQILALQPPFRRGKTLEEFKKSLPDEELVDPVIVAPYRDVPRILSRIVKKCLAINIHERYATVDELIQDVENYIEGRSEWFYSSQLDIKNKSDWEFQENVLIAEHVAITRMTEAAEWVSLMISASSFAGNTKIETEVCIHENGNGIGFLLSIPEASERNNINDGYCLWLGSDINRSTKLLRSNVEVIHAPDIFLKRNQRYRICLEQIEKTIHLYIDDTLQLSYIAHIPLIGTHIGLLARDADFTIEPLKVFVGSLSLMINCLAVPDAFLAHRDFNQALSEYRRIAYSFPDRAEGREAIFRAGLTFIEQSKSKQDPTKKEKFLDQAIAEFEKLHNTPGAPLEYLGKALVYQALNEENEEIKCFELAYRRYSNHPTLLVLQEQLISRMHQVSRYHRHAAYHFILLATRHLPLSDIDTHTRRLFTSLQKHWEHLPFIEENTTKDKGLSYIHFSIQLAFWLAKPYILGEILNDLNNGESLSVIETGNALFCLIELGSWNYAQAQIDRIKSQDDSISTHLALLENSIHCHVKPLQETLGMFFSKPLATFNFQEWRALSYCLNYALDTNQTEWVHYAAEQLAHCELSFENRLQLNTLRIWAYLIEKNWQAAGEILYAYPLELINKEICLLHFLYTCWLQATEGKDISQIHLTGILSTPYPRSWTLASHYLIGELTLDSIWFKRAFLWEKRQLYRQLVLYYDCAGDDEKKKEFKQLYESQFIHVDS